MATLKFYRKKLGFSQQDIASLLNIDQSSYCRKEKGDAPFTVEEAKKLSEVFKKTVEDLFFKDLN